VNFTENNAPIYAGSPQGAVSQAIQGLVSVTYPTTTSGNADDNGVVGYQYDGMSQVTAITNGGSTTYAAYTYLGLGTITGTAHSEVSGGLDLTVGNAQNGYAGLDQWGRVVDQLWETAGENPTVLDEYKYTYDADGDVTSRVNATDAALSELYGYDNLGRLTSAQRGTLSSDGQSVATPTTGLLALDQTWGLKRGRS